MVAIEGYRFPGGLYYSKGHLWVRVEENLARIGITDYLRKSHSRIEFIRVRPRGTALRRGELMGTIESTKWVTALYAPLTCTVVEVNEKLREKPSLASDDPYWEGWLCVVKPENLEELKGLMGTYEALYRFITSLEKTKPKPKTLLA